MSKNEPFDCEKLIDMRADQLDSLIKECEISIDRLRIDIVKTYQQAQPYLIQLTALKRQLKQATEKMEAAKTFLSMENNGSLVSSIDIKSMERSLERNKLLDEKREERLEMPKEEVKRELKRVDSTKFRSPLVDNWTKSKEVEEKRTVKTPVKVSKPMVRRNLAKK